VRDTASHRCMSSQVFFSFPPILIFYVTCLYIGTYVYTYRYIYRHVQAEKKTSNFLPFFRTFEYYSVEMH